MEHGYGITQHVGDVNVAEGQGDEQHAQLVWRGRESKEECEDVVDSMSDPEAEREG